MHLDFGRRQHRWFAPKQEFKISNAVARRKPSLAGLQAEEKNKSSCLTYLGYAMKAMVYHNYGSPDVLEFQEIEKPLIQGDQVLVKVHATSLNWLDWHFLIGRPFLARLMAGLLKPKNQVLGIDLAGQVESVGADVTQFQPGDQVFGSTAHGCFAEYVKVSEAQAVQKPSNLNFEEAAAVPGAAVPALQALRDHAKVQSGQKVLINGASGGVGTFALQIARSFGAQVTGVCSTRNIAMLRQIGADRVIDYTSEDFTQDEACYDLIFDAVAKRTFSECRRALKPQGVYITTEFSPFLALSGMWKSTIGGKKLVPLPPKPPTKKDLLFMKELLVSGEVAPMIDRCYSLSELPEALQYLEKGHARGKVVIKILNSSNERCPERHCAIC
jgi:NADPH:quinone reductase-like Zn-dependent oxidoreductase